jgi:hypothetical protein
MTPQQVTLRLIETVAWVGITIIRRGQLTWVKATVC